MRGGPAPDRAHGCVLGTGTFRPKKSWHYCAWQAQCGVKEMLRDHVTESVIAQWAIEEQREAVRLGRSLEHSFFCPDRQLARNAVAFLDVMEDQIRQVGVEACDPDFGFRPGANPPPVEGFAITSKRCGHRALRRRSCAVHDP